MAYIACVNPVPASAFHVQDEKREERAKGMYQLSFKAVSKKLASNSPADISLASSYPYTHKSPRESDKSSLYTKGQAPRYKAGFPLLMKTKSDPGLGNSQALMHTATMVMS